MSPPAHADSRSRASDPPCLRHPAESPESGRLVFQMPVPQKPPQKTKIPPGVARRRGISCFRIAETLGRAPRARLVAVMMMVSMRPKSHLFGKIQEHTGECQSEDCGPPDSRNRFKKSMLATGARAGGAPRTVIHRHQQMQRHPIAVIGHLLHPNHLRYIFAVHRIVLRSKRKGHEYAHALVIPLPPRLKEYSILGSVHAYGQVFKVLIARL